LDHGLAAEDDVRGPDDLGAARDLVSCVLLRGVQMSSCVLRFEGGDGSVWIGKFGGVGTMARELSLLFQCIRPSLVFSTSWLHGKVVSSALTLKLAIIISVRQKYGHVL
jgi:hypothetical protein